MQAIFLCKGPPAEWIYYAIVCLVASFVASIYFIKLLFNSPFYENIEIGFLKFWTAVGNIIVGSLGGMLLLVVLLALGLMIIGTFPPK
jgi:hypothetical protein